MNITIHDNDTNETGTYKVWFKYKEKDCVAILSEQEANSLLNMRQKEDFFMGQSSFRITSDYDIQQLIGKIKLNPLSVGRNDIY